MRKKMKARGEWKEDVHEKIFWKYQRSLFDENAPKLTLEEQGQAMTIIKDFVYGIVNKEFNNEKIGVPFQNKNSEYMLFQSILWQGEDSKLNKIMQFMEKSHFELDENGNPKIDPEHKGTFLTRTDGIDTVQFSSAVKVGLNNIIDINADDAFDRLNEIANSRDSENVSEAITKYSMDNYLYQQNTPNHLFEKSQEGSQARVLIVSDIDKVFEDGKEIGWFKFSSDKENAKKHTVDEARARLFKLHKQKLELNLKKLKKEFGLSLSKSGGENIRLENIKLSNILKRAMINDDQTSLTDILKICCDNNGNFKVSPSDPSIISKVEQTLYSILKKSTIKMDVNGGTATQLPILVQIKTQC